LAGAITAAFAAAGKRTALNPAPNAAGLTVSRVVYEGSITMDGWAKRLVRQGSEAWQNRLPLKRVEQATLVKTNDGWRDMRELPPAEGVAQTAQ